MVGGSGVVSPFEGGEGVVVVVRETFGGLLDGFVTLLLGVVNPDVFSFLLELDTTLLDVLK